MVIIFLPKLVRHRVVIRRNSFFFLFPFSYRSHFFLQSFGKKFVVEGGDKGSCTRGIVRNEDHFFDGNSRSIIEASYVSPYAGHFPLSFSFFFSSSPSSFSKLTFLSSRSISSSSPFFGYRIIRMDKFVTP